MIHAVLERLKPYVIGLLTYTPAAARYRIPRTGGTDDPDYCYGVFLRHLVHRHRAGLAGIPEVVAELGPGDSLGTGLAWLIAGAQRYLAFDVRRYATTERNLMIFDALVERFRARAPAPGRDAFPEMKPDLPSTSFPSAVLGDAHLEDVLAPERLRRIRESLLTLEGSIAYIVPWDDAANVREGSVDLIFSQAVMEHVEEVDHVYAVCRRWLKRGGMLSHQIDFRSHGTAPTWDGYRAYSELEWRVVRGRRDYLINRVSDAGHLEAIERHGLRAVTKIPSLSEPTVAPGRYAPRFRSLSEASQRTSGLFVQAVLD
ncbi:MAG TPA: methyltransferase domain-containing protein [Candidatus Polarisedimenticolaceae bacterium]|nr:methyltransferase domain-containing protein [Candidatus Polarisedimenticolaceae bacterium]